MDSLKIEAFLKTVECESMSKAAEELFLSQSTLSDRIKSLEKELNTKLFLRKGGFKGIELTNKGKEFIKYALKFDLINKEVENWKNSVAKVEINILAVDSINVYLLKDFYKNYIYSQEVRLSIESHFNSTIYDKIQSYAGDIGIVARPFNTSNTASRALFKEALIIVYNSKYSNYSYYTDLKNLDKNNEIHIDWGLDCERWYLNYWNEDIEPRIKVGTIDLLIQYLNTPDSWALVPLCAWDYMKKLTKDFKTIKTDMTPFRTIYLITQKQVMETLKEKRVKKVIDELEKEIDILIDQGKIERI